MGKANEFFGVDFNTPIEAIQAKAQEEPQGLVGRALSFFGVDFKAIPKEPATPAPVPSMQPPATSKTDYYSKLAQIESSGNTNAASGTSSAVGLYQFTEGTWKDTTKKMGVNYSLSDRTDPTKSRAVVEAFTTKNEERAKTDLGREPAHHELYMYHLLGRNGASELLQAKATEQAIDFVQPRQAKANKNVFYNKTGDPRTVQEVLGIFKRKFQ